MPQLVADDRRSRLLETIRQQGFASLPELSQALGVSESTVRRDVDVLEESGAARRTHGGVFYTGPTPKLPHFEQRQSSEWDKKRAVAVAAAGLIQDGDTVLLDGGSTTYELAQQLVDRPLQVVTNSLPVATLFMGNELVDLVILGGYVHGRTGVSLGPYANDMLADLNVRRAVISIAGVTEQGCYNSNLLLVETEKAMIKAADEVIIVADSTKFGCRNLALICPLDQIKYFVVDAEIRPEWRARLVDAGIDVVIGDSRHDEPHLVPSEHSSVSRKANHATPAE